MSTPQITDGEKLTLVGLAALIIWWLYQRYGAHAVASAPAGSSYGTINMPPVSMNGLNLSGLAGLIHPPVQGKPKFPVFGFVASPGGTWLA